MCWAPLGGETWKNANSSFQIINVKKQQEIVETQNVAIHEFFWCRKLLKLKNRETACFFGALDQLKLEVAAADLMGHNSCQVTTSGAAGPYCSQVVRDSDLWWTMKHPYGPAVFTMKGWPRYFQHKDFTSDILGL